MSYAAFDLSGRTAIVTGAGRGLGRGMAEALAEAGALVVCAGRTLAKVEETAAKIRAADGKAEAFLFDAVNREDCRRLVAETAQRHGKLDIMVVDMPPGTGDAQLTMAQQVPLKGAVIVSTPQDLALIDARRGVAMFKRVNVPVLGVVENMSYFLCPECGTRSDIFSHGGARHEAERLGVPFLGEVPLHMTIREKSDAGLPVVATEPDGPHAKIYRDIAAKVLEQIRGGASAGRVAPKIVIEA